MSGRYCRKILIYISCASGMCAFVYDTMIDGLNLWCRLKL